MIVASGMLKPVYFAFETMLEWFFLQTTHFVKSRAHSSRPTSKTISIIIALRNAILMKADPVVSLHAHVHARPLLLIIYRMSCNKEIHDEYKKEYSECPFCNEKLGETKSQN